MYMIMIRKEYNILYWLRVKTYSWVKIEVNMFKK